MSNSDVEKLPRIAKYKPYYHELKKGERYLWCSCGLSKDQPFCDGSHKGTGFTPVRYEAKRDGEEVLFCGCKHTRNKPFCDGAHNDLMDIYEEDDPNSEDNLRIPEVSASEDGRAVLNGGCYVTQVNKIPMQEKGVLRIGELITRELGARHQSQYYVEIRAGRSPILSFGESDVVVLMTQGSGIISISGRNFEISPEVGVYIRPQEAFAIQNTTEQNIKLYISVCPLDSSPQYLDEMLDNFDEAYPTRVVEIDPDNRQTMADRFFQMLVDKTIGSQVVAQFIGEVPRSKAAMHRHLYEESIVILRGEGYMWTEEVKTKVSAGDIIFLPSKQIHSLQCTDPAGMMLAGVIYPGDNPSINY